MLIQLQLLSSIRCSFIAPLLCRYVPAGIKSKGEMCEVSPLLLLLSRVMRRWIFAYIHVLCL